MDTILFAKAHPWLVMSGAMMNIMVVKLSSSLLRRASLGIYK
jgi:hypothetical protein